MRRLALLFLALFAVVWIAGRLRHEPRPEVRAGRAKVAAAPAAAGPESPVARPPRREAARPARVRVADDRGRPIGAVRITVRTIAEPEPVVVETDAEGRATVSATAEVAYLELDPPDGFLSEWRVLRWDGQGASGAADVQLVRTGSVRVAYVGPRGAAVRFDERPPAPVRLAPPVRSGAPFLHWADADIAEDHRAESVRERELWLATFAEDPARALAAIERLAVPDGGAERSLPAWFWCALRPTGSLRGEGDLGAVVFEDVPAGAGWALLPPLLKDLQVRVDGRALAFAETFEVPAGEVVRVRIEVRSTVLAGFVDVGDAPVDEVRVGLARQIDEGRFVQGEEETVARRDTGFLFEFHGLQPGSVQVNAFWVAGTQIGIACARLEVRAGEWNDAGVLRPRPGRAEVHTGFRRADEPLAPHIAGLDLPGADTLVLGYRAEGPAEPRGEHPERATFLIPIELGTTYDVRGLFPGRWSLRLLNASARPAGPPLVPTQTFLRVFDGDQTHPTEAGYTVLPAADEDDGR